MNEESLFHEALARPEADRAAFLAAACAARPDLRSAVEQLLLAHARSGEFLQYPGGASSVPGSDPANTTDEADASPRQEEAHPRQIGRYAILSLLGRGGMGAVYLAHDPELDRQVAVKVPQLLSPSAEERFLREARAAAAVVHPHLCPVHDAGRADGVLYLAMAYLPGLSLTQLLKDHGPLPPRTAAALVAKVARGMAEAHRHGIVHRDLKPGNILFDRHGEPIVTDFGLALRTDAADREVAPVSQSEFNPRLTQVGVLMGTPGYMPPEQARGHLDQIGPASDVYALGAILFELLTGEPPFRADTLADLVRKIEEEPAPPPSARRRGIPAGLDAVCRRALAKAPADRFPSMDALAAALEAVAVPPRRWGAVVAAAAAVPLLLLAGVILYVKTDHGTVEVRFTAPAEKVEVSIDGNEMQLTANGQVTKMRAGPHELTVKGQGFETTTKLFKVRRGETTVVEVELKPGSKGATKPGTAAADRKRLAELLASGRQALDRRRYEDLGPIATEALTIDPESPGGLAFRAAFRAFVQKDTVGARADVDAALTLNPECFWAVFVRGYLNNLEHKFDDSIADATAAIRLQPKDARVWALRSLAYGSQRQYRQAIADATRSLELEPSWEGYVNRGAGLACLGEYAKALEDYDAAAKLAWKMARVFNQRAALHARMGNHAQADADWATAKALDPSLREDRRPVLPDPPGPPARKKLTADEAAAFAAAMRDATDAMGKRRFDRWKTAVDEACRIDSTSAAARTLRARWLGQQGQFKECVQEATAAIDLDPTDAWAYTARGTARNNQKDHAGAITDQTIALRLDAKNASTWNNRGLAYYHRGQYRQALHDFNESLALNPGFAPALTSRGGCHLRFAEYEKALADYLKAAEAQPTNPQPRRICAAIYAKLGKTEEAARQRQLALKIDPKLKDAGDLELPPPLPPAKQDPEP